MRTSERVRKRVEGALWRAASRVGVDCYVTFGSSVICARGAFLPGGEPGDAAVGAVGDKGRFLFAASVWKTIENVVGASLDFSIQYAGDEWTPEFGAPVVVDPVARFVSVSCYRVLLQRQN